MLTGATSGTCNNDYGDYSGCNRTLCASINTGKFVCEALTYGGKVWRLPTSDEVNNWLAYSVNKGSNGLQLCNEEAGYGAPQCRKTDGCGKSLIGYAYCAASVIISSTSEFEFSGVNWGEPSVSPGGASLRCVSEL